MWHLRRVHMESVGHPDARFDPLTVDLTDADGEPASSVLWLENMGGKTSWLSLVFATLRPSLLEFLGKPDKQLGDYVLATDTSHVILEFAQVAGVRTLTGSGTRLLLGQVLQWKQHRQELVREATQLQRQLWAVVVPAREARLKFEQAVDLIRTNDARRRPMTDFTALLTTMIQGDAFRPDSNQTRWAEWLRHHGLDPEVFADQLKMSADEGSISERFHFADGDELVQWAMPYIIPPAVPDGIATVVDQVRGTLAQRPALLAQQQFCTTVESRLGYAAIQQAQLDQQRAEATGIWDSSLRLVDQFRTATAQAGESVRHHKARAAHYEEVAKAAQSLRNQRQQQGRQAQLVASQLEHEETCAAYAVEHGRLTDAQKSVDAWDQTNSVRSFGEAESRIAQIEALLAEADEESAPLREGVLQAESRLSAKLTVLRRTEQGAFDVATEELAKSDAVIELAEQASKQAQALHTAATVDAATAQERLQQLDRELAQAIEDDLVAPGQPLDDAVVSIDAEVLRLRKEVDRLASLSEEVGGKVVAARGVVSSVAKKEAEARSRYERAKARSGAVDSSAERLFETPGVAAAFESEHPDLWQDGLSAADRLARSADAAMTDRVAVELGVATDMRAVDWLHRTGLLPPSQDVVHILAVLAKAKVRSAFAGWEVLRRQVATNRQFEVVSSRPEIVSGVVLTDPEEFIAAVEATRDIELTAPTVLTVASELMEGQRDDQVAVLPGPAAQYDDDAAMDETDRRQSRIDAAGLKKDEAIGREVLARTARVALLNFLQVYPADAVARWRGEAADCLQELNDENGRLEEARDALTKREAEAQAAAEAVQPARDRHSSAERSHLAIRRLVASQSRRPRELELLSNAAERLTEAERQLLQAAADRTAGEDQASAARTAIAEIGIRLSNIDGAFTRNRLVASEVPPPAEPIDSLEKALFAAREALQAARPPDQLVQEQVGLEKERSEVSASLRRQPADVIDLARKLLEGPEGATADARDKAHTAAKQKLGAAQGSEALARAARENAAAELHEKEAIPQSRRAPLDEDPATPEQARALVDQLAAESAGAHAEGAQAIENQTHHLGAAEKAERVSRAFRRESDDLADLLRRHATLMRRPADLIDEARHVDAWPGSADQAELERRMRQVSLDEAAEYMRIATGERNDALDDVRHLAGNHRELLTKELPTLLPRLTEGNLDQRGAYAQDLATQLRAFALTIGNQLADLERHRRIVIDHLAGKVKETVKLLERMQRRTRLPAGLDEWSDRPFLNLSHPRLPETTDELTGRVGTVVDRICTENAKARTTGMDLLYAAVSASVGGPFHASILKPHKRLTDDRVDISEMASFSGGQKVTAALVMFAALTRMRTEAHSAGQLTNAALPLLLDNPIGKANQATLMEVQQRVADAFGLQLIYTTGLHDVGALASFKNIIRLDGRENPRSGRVHVVIDPEVSDLVYLDSIRLILREDHDE